MRIESIHPVSHQAACQVHGQGLVDSEADVAEIAVTVDPDEPAVVFGDREDSAQLRYIPAGG